MSTPFRLCLPRPLFDEMIEQAKAELPNECCGLLAGRVENGVGRVVRRFPLVNELASPTEYFSEPHSMLAADKAMREEGLDLLAVYHSHPTCDPVPSRKDRERNFYGDSVVHLIVSLRTNPPRVAAWRLTEEAQTAESWTWAEDDASGSMESGRGGLEMSENASPNLPRNWVTADQIRGKTPEEVYALTGVKPVENVEDLLGVGDDCWDSDEDFEEFLTTIRRWRKEGGGARDSADGRIESAKSVAGGDDMAKPPERSPDAVPGTTAHRKTIEELAAEQGVGPIQSAEDLYGDFWPDDETSDEFIAWLRQFRKEGGGVRDL